LRIASKLCGKLTSGVCYLPCLGGTIWWMLTRWLLGF